MTWTLVQKEKLAAEIAHCYESNDGDRIVSTGNRFEVRSRGETFRFSVPLSPAKRLLSKSRLSRRALRLDKSNAVFNYARDGVIVVFQGAMYLFDLQTRSLSRTAQLRQCRNVLHCGIAVTQHGIFLGEYGRNLEREPVPIWRSLDDGKSWEIVYEFPANSIKHIHGIYEDPYTGRLWIPTGDNAGECFVVSADPTFKDVVTYGDGSQAWRPVSMFFEQERIVWPMDSQFQVSHLQEFNRATSDLTQHCAFPGPVWYSKHFTDGIAILQTTTEVGDGVLSDHSHLFVSENLIDWVEVAKYKKDRWPVRFFKSGVIAFADGRQASDDFVLFAEALEEIDGQVIRVALNR